MLTAPRTEAETKPARTPSGAALAGDLLQSEAGVQLSATGRQKLARLHMARAKVLQRIMGDLSKLPLEDARAMIRILGTLIDRTDDVVSGHLGN